MVMHITKPGDTLEILCKRYNMTVSDIIKYNGISEDHRLALGQVLIMGDENEDKLRSITVNGLVQTNICSDVLDNDFKDLTSLSLYCYKAQANGTIIPIYNNSFEKQVNNNACIPFMVLTNIGSSGDYEASLANEILNNKVTVNQLLNNIINTMKIKNFRGINIDFEYLLPKDKDAYNKFIQTIAGPIKDLGYTIKASLIPHAENTSKGEIFYSGPEYEFIGKAVDEVSLKTYIWGSAFSPPMPVAPIKKVEKAIRYAIQYIDAKKITLGIPNYGYDWILPNSSDSSARTISNETAILTAVMYNAEIEYDETYQAPYFHYYDGLGQDHIVWFEDARSFNEKLKLVDQYDLAGIDIWTINNKFTQGITIVKSLYHIK